MTHFLKKGNIFNQYADGALDIHEKLPAGNYIVKVDQYGTFFLESVDSFEFKTKRYGDNERNVERIMRTFMSREVSTGVMLAGTKGSGKSLLAKCLSIKGAEMGIPTIIINAPYKGDNFNRFLQEIDQECIVLFDEFEKTYDRDDQESMLTLLDGVFPSKKLFILTCNDKWRIDTHMRNRPGRIFYLIEFNGLSIEFIEEYCQDNLINKTYIDTMGKISTLFNQFNFDMLKALVEEMNRYDESPQEALKILNIKPEYDDERITYDVKLQIDGIEVNKDDLDDSSWHGNPLASNIGIEYRVQCVDQDDDENNYQWVYSKYQPTDLKQVDSHTGRFVFMNVDGDILTLTKQAPKRYDYYQAL